jgi:hypothetical protein
MIFKLVKEIRSKEGVLHFKRWRILYTPWFKINLHGIYQHDEDAHLHSHPWNFISIVLKGWYSERLEDNPHNVRYPGNIAKRKKDSFHKIEKLHSKSVYTLNFMWGEEVVWGYKVNGNFVDHETYRQLKRKKELE